MSTEPIDESVIKLTPELRRKLDLIWDLGGTSSEEPSTSSTSLRFDGVAMHRVRIVFDFGELWAISFYEFDESELFSAVFRWNQIEPSIKFYHSTQEDPDELRAEEKFRDEWLDFFRRGCFLTGVPIESTRHEQIEWMRWLRDKEAANAPA